MKNYIYIFIILILLVLSSILIKDDPKTFKVDGIKYAVSIDGASSQNFPEKAPYDVVIECTNADALWNYEDWVAEIYNVTNNVSCNITFTSKDKVYLNNNVISLAGKTVGTGEVVNENGYRYEGKNPDNYIKFNNEMWRIIGVFDATSHGQTGLNLTKIIRSDSIGGYAWDKSNVNIWPNSSLYNLLNTYYYNSTNGQDSGYCYQYSTTITGHCDYTNTGIHDYYRPMIKNVTWYLGGYSSASVTAENFFNYERSTSNNYYYSSNTGYKTATGYIGLMYPSDYGYSVLSSSCARTVKLGAYNSLACGGSSWLKKEALEWTLSHNTGYSDDVLYVHYEGRLANYTYAHNGSATRPVLYLDSSVYIIKGTGTESDPYIIAMDS